MLSFKRISFFSISSAYLLFTPGTQHLSVLLYCTLFIGYESYSSSGLTVIHFRYALMKGSMLPSRTELTLLISWPVR